jgi:hypothetical protein
MSKKRTKVERIAEELADLALRHLKTFSESEQEARLDAVERLLQEHPTCAKKRLK